MIDQHVQAQTLIAAGNYVEAVDLYKRILSHEPGSSVALQNIAVCYYQLGQFEAADLSLDGLGSVHLHNAALQQLRGLVRLALKDEPGGAAAYERSLQLNPGNAALANELGCLYLQLAQPDRAESTLRTALDLDPDNLLTLYNLGVAVQQLRDPVGAAALFERCIGLNPDFVEAYCNLGLALVEQGRLEAGVEAYQKAIALRPDFVDAYVNVSKPLVELHRLEEAETALATALRVRPDYPVALENYASVLKLKGDLVGAGRIAAQLLEAQPENVKVRIDQMNIRRTLCDWSSYYQDVRFLRDNPTSVEPFVFLNAGGSAAEQLICANAWAGRFREPQLFSHGKRPARKKITLGYLSADFRRHATTYLISELFERHDRDRFNVLGFSIGYDDQSDERRRVIDSFDTFLDLQGAAHADAAKQIYDRKVDILIDLKGYTGGSRTEIVARRPAPVQVSYLGYPGTMGGDFIDYIVSDNVISPLTHGPFYSEAIAQLPSSYQPNDTQRKISARLYTRAEFGLPETAFVFCSFNGLYKINPDMFDVWMRLLIKVPSSVLWLLEMSDAGARNLRMEAAARGVAPDRIVFSPPMEIAEHLARHKLADLFLDTSPINAHTTASDALWAGLPVLTVLGDAFAGRVAASLLQAVGLPEMIAPTMADYEAIAIHLAETPGRLSEIRSRLERSKAQAPLFDIGQYTAHLETAYVTMWNTYRSGKPPAGFAVEA